MELLLATFWLGVVSALFPLINMEAYVVGVGAIVGDLNGSGLPVVAVDVPSGLLADTHEVPGEAIRAAVTVTLAAPKICHILPPAQRVCGELVVADIGIPDAIIERLDGPIVEVITRGVMQSVLEPRDPEAHKGEFGRVLIVAGSIGRTGAAHLAALGAMRSGAGLVTIAAPRSCVPVVASMAPEYMTEGLDETATGTVDYAALDRVLDLKTDIIAVGPGLGQSPGTEAFVHGLLERSGVPLVLVAGTGYPGAGFREVLYLLNVSPQAQTLVLPEETGKRYALHPVLRADAAADRRAREAQFDPRHGRFVVPARTAVVFVVE